MVALRVVISKRAAEQVVQSFAAGARILKRGVPLVSFSLERHDFTG